MVPRLRTWGSPIVAAALGDGRAPLGSSAEVATSSVHGAGADHDLARRRSRMPASSGMRLMSISSCGSLRRSFISGTRLWPPARSLPAPSAAAILRQRVVERGGARVVECRRRSRLPSVDDAPQLLGPQHHVDVRHAELGQRVHRRVDDARRRARACRLRRRLWRRAGSPASASPWQCSSKRGKSVARGIA